MKTFSKKLSKNWNILGGTTGKELHITPSVSFTYDDSIFKTPKLFIMWLHWGLVLYRNQYEVGNPNSILKSILEVDSIYQGNKILDDMRELLENYDECTFCDYIDIRNLFGIKTVDNKFIYNKYGWKNLNDAKVERLKNYYFLVLPPLTKLHGE